MKIWKRVLTLLTCLALVCALLSAAFLPVRADAASYLASCIQGSTSIIVKTNTATTLMSLPCSHGTDPSSTVLYSLSSGAELTVSALWYNSAGNYWYEISSMPSKCYAYCGHTTLLSYDGTGDLSLDNVTVSWQKGRPSVIQTEKAFTIDGKVTSKNNRITKVTAYIQSGSSTGTIVTSASSTTRNVADTGLDFKKVTAEGEYTYSVTADVNYRYSNDGRTLSHGTAADQYVYGCRFQAVKKYATPKVTVTVANERINILLNKLADEKHFFTKNGKGCTSKSHAGCGNCEMGGVLAKRWILDLLDWKVPVYSIQGNIVHYTPTGGTDTNGQACSGFANYAGWYIFAESSGNKVTFEKHYQGKMTKETMQHAKPGDVLRNDYGEYGHSMIFIKANANSFTVLDCNWTNDGSFDPCIIRKRNVAYSESYTITISRATNYDIPTYAVTYDANGGSGTPYAQTKWKDEPLVLRKVIPTRTGYNFLGWATSATATTVEYRAGADYTRNAAVTLYAVWEVSEVNWSEPAYSWNNDNSTATAMRYNLNNSSQTEEETVYTTYDRIEAETCETSGLGVFTATFTNPAFSEQTKEIVLPPLNHSDGMVVCEAREATCTEYGWNEFQICQLCGYTVDYVEIPALGHDYINGICSRCGAMEVHIDAAHPVLNEDIDIVYAVTVPSGAQNPYMVFTYKDAEFTVTDYTVNASGQYCFAFTGITPQCMGENITATLHAGDATDTVASYSIRQYCVNMLNNAEDAALKTLLSDLLTYGAAAQQYTGYRTSELVTDGLTLSPSDFAPISGKAAAFNGDANAAADWVSAGLILGSKVAMRFTFTAESVDGLTVNISLNGREETFNAEDFVSAGNGKYYIDFHGIEANEFDAPVTAAFSCDSTPLGRSLTYTVNAYICGTQNCENTALRALVRALYNYGASALAYSTAE